MAIGQPKAELVLSAEEQAQLAALAASRSLPHAMVARAQLVLWGAQGGSNRAIARRLGWSMPTVGKWRRRFVEQRVAGLHVALNSRFHHADNRCLGSHLRNKPWRSLAISLVRFSPDGEIPLLPRALAPFDAWPPWPLWLAPC